MQDIIFLTLISLLFYLVPFTLLLIALALFKRLRWKSGSFDLLLLSLPIAIWNVLMFLDGTGKTVGNIQEAAYLGLSLALLMIIRSSFVSKEQFFKAGVLILLISSVIAVLLWGFVPPFPFP